jgi:hypothetical protein
MSKTFRGRAAGALKQRTKQALARVNVEVRRNYSAVYPVEASPRDRWIIEECRKYSMTSPERLWSVIQAVSYVTANDIPGAFVECGVWRGGSAMAMAYKLHDLGIHDRPIVLYDTFEGMTEPCDLDVEVTGTSASLLLETTDVGDGDNVWCLASLQDVRKNLASTGYAADMIKYVVGDVTETLAQSKPSAISLLRLDTDWHESTRVELEVLYPLLSASGVCIIDDYGHWMGARKAVDEYFEITSPKPMLTRLDYSGRLLVKPHQPLRA